MLSVRMEVLYIERFAEHDEASAKHRHAANAAKIRNFVGARQFYTHASDLVRDRNNGLDIVSRRVQLARIITGIGFSYIQEALSPEVDDPAAALEQGVTQLATASAVVEGARRPTGYRLSSEAVKDWHSEKGQIVGSMARLATVAYVLEQPTQVEAMERYETAHSHLQLRNGSSRSAEATNAAFAARQLKLEGAPRQTVNAWVARARMAVDRAIDHQERGAKAARHDLDRRVAYLKTHDIAHSSVFMEP